MIQPVRLLPTLEGDNDEEGVGSILAKTYMLCITRS